VCGVAPALVLSSESLKCSRRLLRHEELQATSGSDAVGHLCEEVHRGRTLRVALRTARAKSEQQLKSRSVATPRSEHGRVVSLYVSLFS
jgi:hypothetical protein